MAPTLLFMCVFIYLLVDKHYIELDNGLLRIAQWRSIMMHPIRSQYLYCLYIAAPTLLICTLILYVLVGKHCVKLDYGLDCKITILFCINYVTIFCFHVLPRHGQ